MAKPSGLRAGLLWAGSLSLASPGCCSRTCRLWPTGRSRPLAPPGGGQLRARAGGGAARGALVPAGLEGAAPAARADSRCAQRARAAATLAPASGSSGPADGAAEPRGRCPAAAGRAAPPGTASLGSSLRGTLPGTRKRKRRRSRGPASRRERAGVQPGGSRGGAVRAFLLRSGFLRSRPGWLRSGEVLAPGRPVAFPPPAGAPGSVPSTRGGAVAAEGDSRPSASCFAILRFLEVIPKRVAIRAFRDDI